MERESAPKWNFFPWLLVASLGLNLFFAGWLLGRSGPMLRPPFGPWFGPEHFREFVTSNLSDAGARTMIQSFDDMRLVFDRGRERFDLSRRTLNGVLDAPSFDKPAFLAKKADERAARLKNETEADEIFADGLARLSPEDRRKLARMPFPPLALPPPR